MSIPSHSTHQSYRPDIDGLRAIAVLGVVLCHANPNLLSGGFVGVDVFFVISGFLITSILLRQAETGMLSIATFYERRIRRIVPALMVLMAVVMVAGFFELFPWDYEKLARSAKYALGSASNILFYRDGTGYFENADTLPLLHTWSLGVEEQFYFFYPLLFFIGCRFKHWRTYLPWAILTLCTCSLALCLNRMNVDTKGPFYLIPYRAWELGIGALLATYLLAVTRALKNKWMATLAGLIGLTMIFLPMVLYDADTHFPGLAALWPCLGSALVIASGHAEQSWARRLLAAKPLAFVGLISYSVYLWHWPLLAFQSCSLTQNLDGPDHAMRLGLALLAIPIGYLSWRWIETPFRTLRLKQKTVFAAFGCITLAAVIATHAIQRSRGLEFRVSPDVKHWLSYEQSKNPLGIKEFMDTQKTAKQHFTYGDASQPAHIALWGDSHARAIAGILHPMGLEKKTAIRFYGMPSTPPIAGAQLRTPLQTAYANDVLQTLETDPQITTVILECYWWGYHLNLSRFNNTQPLGTALQQTIARLRTSGKRVVVIYPFPEMAHPVPKILAQAAMKGASPEKLRFPADSLFFKRNIHSLAVLNGLPDGSDLIRIKPYEMFVHSGKFPLVTPKGDALLFDCHHITQETAATLRPLFEFLFEVQAHEMRNKASPAVILRPQTAPAAAASLPPATPLDGER